MKEMISISTLTILVILAPTTVWATNEGSYIYGFKAGFDSYQCLSEDARYLAGSCPDGMPNHNVTNWCVDLAANSGGKDTNSTACIDGYFNGWTHWCKAHAKQCIQNEKPVVKYLSPVTSESHDRLMKSDPLKYGYLNGILDGKASARDSSSVCGGYNSTADANGCYHGYDLGFKKGCEGNPDVNDTNGEYPSC